MLGSEEQEPLPDIATRNRPRVLLVFSERTQHEEALQRLLRSEELDVTLVFLSQRDEANGVGEEYLNKEVFRDSVVSNLPHLDLKNRSFRPGLGRFFGLIHPELISRVRRTDCVVVYGHQYCSFWLAILAAKLLGKRLVLSNDATEAQFALSPPWKQALKQRFFRFLYNRLANALLVASTAGRDFFTKIGVRSEQIVLTPYCVDNDSITERAKSRSRDTVRNEWKVPLSSLVLLFCGKLIERKNPKLLLDAFSAAKLQHAYLVIIGDGPLRRPLEKIVHERGLEDRVRWCNFVPYRELPSCYAAADILVHPGKIEPFGLVLNEAMLCGCVVLSSSRVGAASDLITPGETGFVFESEDLKALTENLVLLAGSAELRSRVSNTARERMRLWSPKENAEALQKAVLRCYSQESLK